jgi:hypothetical protein
MSPLWSDMALARAAWAKTEHDSVYGAKDKPLSVVRPAAAGRPVRRVLHPRLGSLAL